MTIQYFVLFVGVLFVCSQMSEPHSGLTLKCAKCGVVSTTALSATTASNAMLVPIIYIFLLQIVTVHVRKCYDEKNLWLLILKYLQLAPAFITTVG